MNTSHYSQNLSEIVASDAKTGENLNRLGKISEKLKNIHSNITSEKYSRYAEVESRLSALNDKTEESQNEPEKTHLSPACARHGPFSGRLRFQQEQCKEEIHHGDRPGIPAVQLYG